MFKKIIQFFCAIIVITTYSLFGINIGSDSSVNRFDTQQILNNGDRVASFAALYGGVGCASSIVTGIWDSVFPMGGPLSLNNGTLVLNSDLFFENNAYVFSVGNITGQNHQWSLASTSTVIQASATSGNCTISNLNIFLNSDVYIRNCYITFTGNNMINGQGLTMNLLSTATIILGSNATLHLKNITINGMRANRMYASSTTSTFIFNNTTINLDADYSFSTGRFEIYNDVLITGSGFGVNYSSTGASFIGTNGRLILDQGVTFSYMPSNLSNSLLNFTDNSGELFLRGGILYAGSGGLQLLKGTLSIDKQSKIINTGASSANGIILGDGINATNNMHIRLFPAAVLNVLQGFLVNKNV